MSGAPGADARRDLVAEEWSVPEPVREMLKNQAGLPRLPVPPLGETCVKYLKTARHLLSEAEFRRTCQATLDFALSDEAASLQQRLLNRVQEKKGSSWLIDWWNQRAYLADRGPVVFWVSYFFLFRNFSAQIPRAPFSPKGSPQCVVAAAITDAALNFRAQVLAGTLTPDVIGGKPQCMAAYPLLFNACRIPAFPSDVVATYASPSHTHILALRRGRIFSVPTHAPRSEGSGAGLASAHAPPPLRLSKEALEEQFARVIAMADAAGDVQVPIGALTSAGRDEWARARAHLLAFPGANAQTLATIESAAFTICLDAAAPPADDSAGRARVCWHGDARNRFYDKPLQFLVMPDGHFGFLGEHAVSDGGQTLRICDTVIKEAVAKPSRVTPPRSEAAPPPGEILFSLPPEVEEAARKALVLFDATVADHQATLLVVDGLGSNGIKQLGVAPDPFCQLAMQLAFFRVHGRFGPTYEAASTRSFLHGRTETIRSCSPEAAAFVRSMCDGSASGDKKRDALALAAAAHRRQAGECAVGKGIDRHLLGFRALLQEDSKLLPEVFTDKAFGKCGSWEMSTSNLSHERMEAWGFGEVMEQGYGMGYSILSSRVQFFITCKGPRGEVPSRAEAMKEGLRLALRDMEELCAARRKPAL
mmetsp:Transcript_7908/g.18152  ORF Transcript_7908/g.18152 Transcript_7908/m.18152 type:complete len:647 (+) Transcript_7908:477-2417(+)